MRILKLACVALGALHALVMTAFALGPELSPLMVLIVDAPVAQLTKGFDSRILAYGVPIAACSVLYPGLIFLIGRMFIQLAAKSRRA